MSDSKTRVLLTSHPGTTVATREGIFNPKVQDIFNALVSQTEEAGTKIERSTQHVCVIGQVVRRASNLRPLIDAPDYQSEWDNSAVRDTVALVADFKEEEDAAEFGFELMDSIETACLDRGLIIQKGPVFSTP